MDSTKTKGLITLFDKIYDLFLDEKRKLLNHPKMLTYLFARPIIQGNNLKSAIKVLDDEFNHVIVHSIEKNEIESILLSILDSLEKIQLIYSKYRSLIQKHDIIKMKKIIEINNKKIFEKITNILDDLGVTFVFNWSFDWNEKYNNANKIKPYNFKSKIEVDFYGCLFSKNNPLSYKMYQFAILYDTKDKKITKNDYLVQYNLQQMGIHFIRLNYKSKPKSEIKKFLKQIQKVNKFHVINALSVVFDIGKKNLINFQNDYVYNHIIYLKYYDKHPNIFVKYQNDFDNNKNISIKEPPLHNIEGTISKKLANELLKSKYFFTNEL